MWWESPSKPLGLVPSTNLYFVTNLKESPYELTVSSGPIDGAGCKVCVMVVPGLCTEHYVQLRYCLGEIVYIRQ